MVRLKDRDDLGDIKGKLGTGFRAASLASLLLSFAAAAPDKKNAARALDNFYRVAGKLSTSEGEFNKRARAAAGTPSLMANLRGPEHFAALREFSAAKTDLLEINPTVGQHIIHLIEKDIDVSARTQTRGVLSATIG